MGWFPLPFQSMFGGNLYSYAVGAVYHRKELSGKWVVKFNNHNGESSVEEFAVRELNYPTDKDKIEQRTFELIGSGKKGTAFSGLSDLWLFWSRFGPFDSHLEVSGTFANPLWNE